MGSARLTALLTIGALAVAGSAGAAEITRDYARPDARFASSITVPAGAETVYFSGALAPPSAPGVTPVVGTDTESQTAAIFRNIETQLKAKGMSLADVVNVKVYLVGDPAKGGAMDFAGMNAAYAKLFGTPQQPNRPTRSTFQVAGLAVAGVLVEIDVVAARVKR